MISRKAPQPPPPHHSAFTKKKRVKGSCCHGCCRKWSWNKTLQVFAIILIILAIAAIVVGVFWKNDITSLKRVYVDARAENVVGGPGEPGNTMYGEIAFDSSRKEIRYVLRYDVGTLSTVQALHIRGPVSVNTMVGGLKFPLCGSPSSVVCDVISTPGELSGTLTHIQPGGTSVRPEIENVINAPLGSYYLEVLTSNHPATPGALRAPLSSTF